MLSLSIKCGRKVIAIMPASLNLRTDLPHFAEYFRVEVQCNDGTVNSFLFGFQVSVAGLIHFDR